MVISEWRLASRFSKKMSSSFKGISLIVLWKTELLCFIWFRTCGHKWHKP